MNIFKRISGLLYALLCGLLSYLIFLMLYKTLLHGLFSVHRILATLLSFDIFVYAVPAFPAFFLMKWMYPNEVDEKDIVCRIGNLTWNKNQFCRGWLTTGKTGSGKTECGLNQIRHGLFQNAKGVIRKGFTGSALEASLLSLRSAYEKVSGDAKKHVADLEKELHALQEEEARLSGTKANEYIDELLSNNLSANPQQALSEEIQRIGAQIEAKRAELGRALYELRLLGDRMVEAYNRAKDAMYERYPWGGLLIDEKGLDWQVMVQIAAFYHREHDLLLLQTRPSWADESWRPTAKLNILSDETMPASTYATIIVETAEACSGGKDSGQPYFPTQAKQYIETSITLFRAIRKAKLERGVDPSECEYPSLLDSFKILTGNKDIYMERMKRCGVLEGEKVMTGQDGIPHVIGTIPAAFSSPEITDALKMMEIYWSTAPDELSGIKGTIKTYLAYFAEPAVAEVFCEESTVSFDEIDKGRIWCVAMDPHLRVHRRIIQTLLKKLFYQHVQNRFGLLKSELDTKNLLVLFQDEAQRFFGEEDGDTDTIRAAGATTILISQGNPSMLAALRDKDKAKVTLSNLTNRLILGAYSDECAKMSSEFIGKVMYTKTSTTRGRDVSRNYSREAMYKVPPCALTELKDFTAFVKHCDHEPEKYILAPLGPDGEPTSWWPKACPYWWLKPVFALGIVPKCIRLRMPHPGP